MRSRGSRRDSELSEGRFDARLVGHTENGKRVFARVAAQSDPGYQATVTFVCEAAILLATRRDSLPGGGGRGGVLTPATALGLPYIVRLQERGITFETTKVV